MADLNFDPFSVLVVEDNDFIRRLLVSSLRALGVGSVKHASDGGEAIELLKLMGFAPMQAGVMSVDIILSNWQMSPIDGLMLLRWVRRHRESPNRFIPFIMVTGYADRGRVAQARDLGTTEILAKPFSVQHIVQKVLRVIEKPRQFVHAPDYFGPDRRRRNVGPSDGAERRVMTEDEIEVIYDHA